VTPGPTRVVDANGISIASAVFAGLLSDRQTDRPTDHATLLVTIYAERTLGKPKSVIVYGYNKYFLEQSSRQTGSTAAISSSSSYIQL